MLLGIRDGLLYEVVGHQSAIYGMYATILIGLGFWLKFI